jgi:hypothetical protein
MTSVVCTNKNNETVYLVFNIYVINDDIGRWSYHLITEYHSHISGTCQQLPLLNVPWYRLHEYRVENTPGEPAVCMTCSLWTFAVIQMTMSPYTCDTSGTCQ